MSGGHASEYDSDTTELCERALVTLLGDIGPWSERVYLVGGLAPRYIVGTVPPGVEEHIGTTDVDLVIALAVADDAPETYRTLENNLRRSGFSFENSARWTRNVEGVKLQVEFLCDTDQVEPGKIFMPKGESVGSGLGAFNIPGAHLVTADFTEHEVEAERLDGGGLSRVRVRVCGLLTYVVLKVLAFQDRHDNKDAYDLVFCLTTIDGGPAAAAERAATSPALNDPIVGQALTLLSERFVDVDRDGPIAYAAFTERPDDDTRDVRRQTAVAALRQFLGGLSAVRP